MFSCTTLKASRLIMATPRAIFRTLLDPETIPTWRTPRGIAARLERFDPRPGGSYRMMLLNVHDDDGDGESGSRTDVIDVEFVDIIPDEKTIETIRFNTNNPRFQTTMTVITTLEPLKDGTKVTLTAQDIAPRISEPDHRATMDAILKNLANFVE